MIINLLKETLDVLYKHRKSSDAVLWVGNGSHYTSWHEFALSANFEYNNGFGAVFISTRLVVVGPDWWLARWEYDGSEGWSFRRMPFRPAHQCRDKAEVDSLLSEKSRRNSEEEE